ncbi:MAG: hypothetical protein V3T47_09030 [Gammaproteobacteria bacterium]
MDQYSLAELTELYFAAATLMDTQFQYWISVTFAVVIAGFFAGNRLTKNLSYLAAILYGLATFVLIARFTAAAGTVAMFGNAIVEAGVEMSRVGLPTRVLRYILFTTGTLAALYFLLRQRRSGGENG